MFNYELWNIDGTTVCEEEAGGAWECEEKRFCWIVTREQKWDRGADGTLSLFTEQHHITTKFNLISTKLRQIHLDTASEKSLGARCVFFLIIYFFITVKKDVTPLICSSGSSWLQIGAGNESLWRLLSKQRFLREGGGTRSIWRLWQSDGALFQVEDRPRSSWEQNIL